LGDVRLIDPALLQLCAIPALAGSHSSGNYQDQLHTFTPLKYVVLLQPAIIHFICDKKTLISPKQFCSGIEFYKRFFLQSNKKQGV
jgi:hypothetical protein